MPLLANLIGPALEVPVPRPGTAAYSRLVSDYGGTRALAGDLGVSQRTIQRWIKGDRAPGRSEAGRRASGLLHPVAQARHRRRIRRRGADVTLGGWMTPSWSGGPSDLRDRDVGPVQLTGGQMGAVLNDYEAGHLEAAARKLERAVFDGYGVPGMALERDERGRILANALTIEARR